MKSYNIFLSLLIIVLISYSVCNKREKSTNNAKLAGSDVDHNSDSTVYLPDENSFYNKKTTMTAEEIKQAQKKLDEETEKNKQNNPDTADTSTTSATDKAKEKDQPEKKSRKLSRTNITKKQNKSNLKANQ